MSSVTVLEAVMSAIGNNFLKNIRNKKIWDQRTFYTKFYNWWSGADSQLARKEHWHQQHCRTHIAALQVASSDSTSQIYVTHRIFNIKRYH